MQRPKTKKPPAATRGFDVHVPKLKGSQTLQSLANKSFIVQGGSMLPTFPPGATIIADTCKQAKPNDYVLAGVGTQKLLRQLILVNGEPRLVTTGDDSPPIDDFFVWARVEQVGVDLGEVA